MRAFKRNLIVLGLISAAIIAGAGLYFVSLAPPDKVAGTDNSSVSSGLSENYAKGLAPGEEVSFEILSADGEARRSKVKADDLGNAAFSELPSSEKDIIAYRFSSKDFDLLFKKDPVSAALSLSASGFPAFSDVEIRHGEEIYKTRTDWSGLLSEMNVLKLSDDAPNSEVEVAFYGLNDTRPESSNLLVKVQLAVGGGGPTADGVNVFKNLGCKIQILHNIDLSTCFPGQHEKQIDLIKTNYVRSLMKMTEQLSVQALQQMQMIGSFFDANQILQSQRAFQKTQAEAVKDYHPSEEMCRVGSFMRSIAASDQRSYATKQALNKVFMARYTNEEGGSSADGPSNDAALRIAQFKKVYCDVHDNDNGLSGMCGSSAPDKQRLNKDIDFTKTFYMPATLDLDFEAAEAPEDLEDIIAMGKNLYGPSTFENPKGELDSKYKGFMDIRQVIAMQNVAHNSFVSIAAMKAAEPNDLAEKSGGAHMKSMMREFGLSDDEITKMLGKNPSYYAQMDVLSKKMLQNPDFYTNLYDKPTNVKRMDVSMQAIQLMQARDAYESSLRREMLIAMMVEEAVTQRLSSTNSEMKTAVQNSSIK